MAAVVVPAALGCSGPKTAYAPVPANLPPIVDANASAGPYPQVDQVTYDGLAAGIKPVGATSPAKKPLNVMAIAGGGQYGAYAAGLLVGWTARGDRPDFDVMTGISSGALIATIAFMGPKYDPMLERVFTNLHTEDLFKYRPIPVHVLRDQSIASSKPFREMLERDIGDEFIADLKAAHLAGRRLFVGTMNLQTRRLVIWDLGAIAASGRPSARCEVITVLYATSSITGVAPPVPINVTIDGVPYTELHVDGGALSQAFLRLGPTTPKPDPAAKPTEWLAGSNLYSIAGGKLFTDPHEGKIGLISSVIDNISGSLYALYRADLWHMYTFCTATGMRFHHAAIPQDLATAKSSTKFDPIEQKKLYAVAYEMMLKNQVWRQTPPGYEASEYAVPRAGFDFRTVPPSAPCVTAIGAVPEASVRP